MKKQLLNEFKTPVYWALIFLMVFFIYTIFFGLNNGELLTTNDGIHYLVSWIMNSLDMLGEISPFSQGGIALKQQLGIPFWPRLLGPMGLSGTNIINIQVLFVHSSLSYLLFLFFRTDRLIKNVLILIPIIILMSFSPVIFYRIHYGHLEMALSSSLIVTLILLFKWLKDELTLNTFDHIFILILLSQMLFTSSYFQMFYYFCISLLMLVVYSFIDKDFLPRIKGISKSKLYILLVYVLILGFCFYQFMIPILLFYTKGNAFRGGSEDVLFSYVTTTIYDLTSWLFVSSEVNAGRRDHFFLHETNFPIFQFWLSYFLISTNTKKKIWVSSVILLWILFTMNIPFVASFFKIIFPKVEMFRVPLRFLILIYPLLILGILEAFNINDIDWKNKKFISIGSLLLISSFLIPSFFTDLLIWIGLIVFVFTVNSKFHYLKPYMAILIALMLVSGSLKGSMVRVTPYKNLDSHLNDLVELGNSLRSTYPELKNPLIRTTIDFVDTTIPYSLASSLRVHTLDGYHYTTKRFSEFMYLMNPRSFNKGMFQFLVFSKEARYSYFSQIFNLKYILNADSSGKLALTQNHQGAVVKTPTKIHYCKNLNICLEQIRIEPGTAFIEQEPLSLNQVEEEQNCQVNFVQSSDFRVLSIKNTSSKKCFVVIPHESLLYTNLNPEIKIIPANIGNAGLWIEPNIDYKVKIF